jgi:hypothetical protein
VWPGVKVELHGIVADCSSCHGTDFEPQGTGVDSITSHTPMICTACGLRAPYIQLLIQIGDKAITRSLETLERIRAQRAKTKPTPPE